MSTPTGKGWELVTLGDEQASSTVLFIDGRMIGFVDHFSLDLTVSQPELTVKKVLKDQTPGTVMYTMTDAQFNAWGGYKPKSEG